MKMLKVQCKGCGKDFEVSWRSSKKKYCSEDCKTFLIKCKECKKEFETNDPQKEYCTKTCQRSYYNREVWYKKNKTKCQEWEQKRAKTPRGHALKILHSIQVRCSRDTHPDYPNYGGRGIKCLFERESFVDWYVPQILCSICGKEFKKERGPDQKTIDRINSNGHYELSNCRIICRSCNVIEIGSGWERISKVPVWQIINTGA